VLDGLIKRWPWVKHLFGDAAYDRRQLMDKAVFLDFTVEVVRRLKGSKVSLFSQGAGRSSERLHG
jgi:putative transposase